MKHKVILTIILSGITIILISGCSRQQLGYSVLQMFGFTSDYSYLQEIESGTELELRDDIEAIVEYDRHPIEGNDINFYSAQITEKDDINSITEQILNNSHWNKTPVEANISDALFETDALEEAGFPKVNKGYYIFYWDFDESTADEIEKIYGVPEGKTSKINAETCKNLGYFDTDSNIIYYITFFKTPLES